MVKLQESKKFKLIKFAYIFIGTLLVIALTITLTYLVWNAEVKALYNEKLINAVKEEYALVGESKVEELDQIEWEDNTKCYVVANQGNMYYVAVTGETIDVDDNWSTFCWLHKKVKEA